MLPIKAVIVTSVLLKLAGVPAESAGTLTLSLVRFMETASRAPSETPSIPPVAEEGKKGENNSFGTTPSVLCVVCKTEYLIQ